jgi:hypothetical protein
MAKIWYNALCIDYTTFFLPINEIAPATITAATMIRITAPPAVEAGMPCDLVAVGVAGGSGDAVDVSVEVGQRVAVGKLVGVEVGRVVVGVYAAWTMIFSPM